MANTKSNKTNKPNKEGTTKKASSSQGGQNKKTNDKKAGFFASLSANRGIAVAIAIAAVALVAIIVVVIVIAGSSGNSDTTTTAVTTTTPSTTTLQNILVVQPTQDADVVVGEDSRVITIIISEDKNSVDFKSMVKAEEEWNISNEAVGGTYKNGMLSLNEGSSEADFTLLYGHLRIPYRITLRHRYLYSVEFEGCGTMNVYEGDRAVAGDAVPYKQGYTFAGWDFDFSTIITADTKISAKWTANKYTVTYNADGGNVSVTSAEIVFGEELNLPIPTRTGYNFMGWYYNGEAVTSGEWKYASDVTLVALWDNNDYKITYDANGGYVEKPVQGISYGDALNLQTPTKNGYSFVGWFLDGVLITANKYEYTKDIELVAKWTENTYTLVYVTNGGNEIESEERLFSELGSITAIPEREGYTFGGWYFNSDLNASSVILGSAGTVNVYAWWTEESKAADFEYKIDGDKAIIVGYKSSSSITIVPSYIAGYPVTALGENAFSASEAIQHIELPDSVTVIGERAFAGCTNLKKINPIENTQNNVAINLSGIESIGIGAFAGSGIMSIALPESITEVPAELFAGCKRLVSVNLNNAEVIGNDAFYGCTALLTFELSDKITSVGDRAFSNCTGLESFRLSASVVSIGEEAFAGCIGLLSFNINEVKALGKGAFKGCTALTTVTFSRKLEVLPESVFENCTALTSLESLVSATSVSIIEERAFAGCIKLSEISLPSGLTEIGEYAFDGCLLLTSVTIPAGVTQITDGLFKDCTRLSNVILPATIKSVGNEAFKGCRLISEISLKSGVTHIGEEAFTNCVNLYKLTLPSTLETIGKSAFKGCVKLDNVVIPESVKTVSESAFEGCTALSTLTLHADITEINARAFADCLSLSSVDIPENIEIIGEEAFKGALISSVTIGDRLVSLESRAFADCVALISVEFTGTSERWKGAVAEDAFEGCTSFSGVVSTTQGKADDISYYIEVNASTGALWAFDTTLEMNEKTHAVVIKFLERNPFYKNLIDVNSQSGDPFANASLNSSYVWKLTVAGETFTISNSQVINYNGGYVILDISGAGFIPFAGLAKYEASLEIYKASTNQLLYTATLGTITYKTTSQSDVVTDTNREEVTPLDKFEVLSGPSADLKNGVSAAFDNDTETTLFTNDRTPIIIKTETPIVLASYSIITASSIASYPCEVYPSWIIYGGYTDDNGEIVYEELSSVDNSKISLISATEFNYNVESNKAYSYYKIEFLGEKVYSFAELDFYEKIS